MFIIESKEIRKDSSENNHLKKNMIYIIIFIGILGSALTLVFSVLTHNYLVTNLVHISSIVVYLIMLSLVKMDKSLNKISWFIMFYYFYLLIGAYISTTLYSHITRIVTIYVGVIIIVLFEKKVRKFLLIVEATFIMAMIEYDITSPKTYIKIEKYLDATFEINEYFNIVIGSLVIGVMILIVLALYKELLMDVQNELHIRSIKDPLTEAYNIRYFERQLNRNNIWWKVDKIPFSIAILDVDNFKIINDNYGHLKGDEVLRDVVKLILGEIHSADEVYRYGGDEFIVLFPKMHVYSASKLMENVISNLRNDLDCEIPITVSIGVCDIAEASECGIDILKLADKRMYFAKNYTKGNVRSVGGEVYE